MSSDTYYQPYETPEGMFAVAMGFASDDGLPHLKVSDPVFPDELSALRYGTNHYSEFGCYPIQKIPEHLWKRYLAEKQASLNSHQSL